MDISIHRLIEIFQQNPKELFCSWYKDESAEALKREDFNTSTYGWLKYGIRVNLESDTLELSKFAYFRLPQFARVLRHETNRFSDDEAWYYLDTQHQAVIANNDPFNYFLFERVDLLLKAKRLNIKLPEEFLEDNDLQNELASIFNDFALDVVTACKHTWAKHLDTSHALEYSYYLNSKLYA